MIEFEERAEDATSILAGPGDILIVHLNLPWSRRT